MSEFTWMPDRGFTTETAPRVRTAKFGDGYSQRVADGINNLDQTWNLTFNSRSLEDADAIEAFLVSKEGAISFTWTPPGTVTEYWVICPKWSLVYESEFSRNISVSFEKVYD